MAFQYKVVPFRGHAKGNLDAAGVAKQLEAIIQQHAVHGWEFYQLSDVNIEVQPGCVAGLLGAKVEYARFDQLIFRASGAASMPEVAPNTIESEEAETSLQIGPSERSAGWRCSCGQVNPAEIMRCSQCRKWRTFVKR